MNGLIEREQLIELVSQANRYKLTLLLAPAGSGKSTLLDQWQQAYPNNNVARVNLGGAQPGVHYALKCMLDEIRKTVQVYVAPIFNLFNDQLTLDEDFIVHSMQQVLASINTEIYLVIDDYHNVDSEYARSILSKMLVGVPDHVHMIISSRYPPRINLSRLKLENQLLQIDSVDLMLNEQDLSALNQEVTGKPLMPAQYKQIIDRTEGWMAGVKIALLSYEKYGETALEHFDGNQPDMADYFGYEIYQALPEELQEFFLYSSVLDLFNAELCNVIFQRNDSEQVIERLLHYSVFLVEVEDKPGWYRYHSLIAEYVRQKIFEVKPRSSIGHIHKQCAEYCFNIQEYCLSLDHGAKSNDMEFYNVLLKRVIPLWLKTGDFNFIIHRLGELDESLLLGDERLSFSYAYSLIFSRRFNQAHYFLENLKVRYESEFHNSEFDGDLQFLEMSLHLFQHDTEALCQEQVDALVTDSYVNEFRLFAYIILAYRELQGGNLNEALRVAHKAKHLLGQKGFLLLESYAHLIIALCERYKGRGVEAVNYISALNATHQYPKGGLAWVNVNTAMVVVEYEQNRLKEAKNLCESLLPNLTYACVTEVIATVYLYYSRLLFIEGDCKKANRVLEQLQSILVLGDYPRFTCQYVQESMRQAFVQNDVNKIRKLTDQHALAKVQVVQVDDAGRYQESVDRLLLAHVYGLTAREQFDQAEAILQPLMDKLDALSMVSRSLIAKSNLVVVYYKRGCIHAAIAELKRLVNEYGLMGFSRNIFDETPNLNQVFLHAHQHGEIELPDLFRAVFHDLFSVEAEVEDPKTVLGKLTDKEQRVYALLASGLSNAEISKQLNVAVTTTKWHLKNIYQKLGVANRTEAIVLARD